VEEELLVDRAQLLGLTAPEMTVLLGGLRVLGANSGGSALGVFTTRVGTLSNDFFRNLLAATTTLPGSRTRMAPSPATAAPRAKRCWQASRSDLIFGSNSQLRALAEYYATDDALPGFVADFAKAWTKVMEADRFDVK
jgi:catalase-peroxidase